MRWHQGKQNQINKKKQEMKKSASRELTFKPDMSKSRSRSRNVSPGVLNPKMPAKNLKKNLVSEMRAVDKFLERMKLAQEQKKEKIAGT